MLIKNILILYNRPAPHIFAKTGYAESDSGVLNEVSAVAEALKKLGLKFHIASVKTLADVATKLKERKESIVFNLVERLDGSIADYNFVPALCNAMGKACTGSSSESLFITHDKLITKYKLLSYGISVPQSLLIPPFFTANPKYPSFPPPYIIKPVATDGSEGIFTTSVLYKKDKQIFKIASAIHRKYKQPALLEKFIEGREFNVSVFQDGNKVIVLPVSEIDFSLFPVNRPHVVDYEIKWKPGTIPGVVSPRKIPASLNKNTEEKIKKIALKAWNVCKCNDYARIDMRMDKSGKIYILEINTNPDISPMAGFPAALKAAGIPFARIINTILSNAIARLNKF